MVDKTSSTMQRRELGHRLRELRLGRGLTLEQVAEELMVSESKLSRIEHGQRRASLRDIRDLCALYEVSEVERDRLMELTKESRSSGWWEGFDLPYLTYIGLEQAAVAISEYSNNVIPGLLQTPDYSTALAAAMDPTLEREALQQRAGAKHARREILTRPTPPRLRAIVEDAALTRVVGGHLVMSTQIAALIKAVHSDHISLLILPPDLGAHPALNSNFVVLDLGSREVSDVVYVEGLVGNIYLEKPADVQRYRHVFDQLEAAALSPRLSLARMVEAKSFHDRKSREPTVRKK